MRSAFGKYSEMLRLKHGISQTAFSENTGMSLSRISNIENQRSNISDDVIRTYIKALNCSGEEAHEIRKLATFSNGLRKRSGPVNTYPPLQVMFEQFGHKISPKTAARIQQILERETGELVETLCFASNKTKANQKRWLKNKNNARPSLTPERFAEIAMQTLDLRRAICPDMAKLDIDRTLQVLSVNDELSDYRILEQLPSHLSGAFACIIGDADGHTILIEETRLQNALNGVHFFRHVICHEIGHHFLHGEQLTSDQRVIFAPQELAKNACDMIGSDEQIEQVIDTIVEVEAECFATFLLVPWEAFIKGTTTNYLAEDYGEQKKEIDRYMKFFNIPSVVNAFKQALWDAGQRQHPIFKLHTNKN